jgi:DNA-binding transcriptional LysR family regulator
MARTLAGNGLGFGVLNLIPNSPVTYDGTLVQALPFQERLSPLRIICVRLPDMPLRRISRAFLNFSIKYFSTIAKIP